MIVPNRFPSLPSGLKLAIIGEAPGADEEKQGQPFVGASGRFLAALLSRAGISREACFLGNISQHRPPGNDFSQFTWDGVQVQHGLERLREDLDKFKPNIVVLLGNVPLKAAKAINDDSKKPRFSNAKWRGSLFLCDQPTSPFFGYKCLPSYHPAYCLRDYEATPLLQFDLRKAVRQAGSPVLNLPQRVLRTSLSCLDTIRRLQDISAARLPVALDIEGGVYGMSCISFASSPVDAFIVPFTKIDGSSYWSESEELDIWPALARVLEDPGVPKVLQNSLYDRFVLHYAYGIRVRNTVDDTMLRSWELYSELEKSLAMQASLYTDEPYYKGDRKSQDDTLFYEYCCRDSAVTLEINQTLASTHIQGCAERHYRMNVQMLNPLLYMELRGISYDIEGAASRRSLLRRKMFEVQARLNGLTGRRFSWDKGLDELHQRTKALMWTKKGDRLLKDYVEPHSRLEMLLQFSGPDLATLGEIEDLCEVSLNVSAPKNLCTFLYEEIGLPTQTTHDENPRPTADYEALLKLSKICQQEPKHSAKLPIIQAIIELRALSTREGMLAISADRDKRIRCGYNIVGSNTGRITCYESPTGSGYNLQTIPNYTSLSEAPGGVLGDRDLFLADDGHWFFQCDLSGADGWTVAAYSAMLGDPTMLEDYKAGLSPFTILTLKLLGIPGVNFADRESIKAAKHHVKKDSWERFAMKRVQHGGCYLEGGLTISRNILKDSEGKLYISPKECDELKDGFFFVRYRGVRLWHNWIAARLKERPILQAASGQVRQFFGRADDILTKAVAFEPQANTTYATNLAMLRLWTDPENRTTHKWINKACPLGTDWHEEKVRLRVEPLHQVHDALCGQFRKDDTPWAISKIQQWFNNPLKIANQDITIPFDGAYGPSWGQLNEGKI